MIFHNTHVSNYDSHEPIREHGPEGKWHWVQNNPCCSMTSFPSIPKEGHTSCFFSIFSIPHGFFSFTVHFSNTSPIYWTLPIFPALLMWLSGNESACQYRTCRLDPRSGEALGEGNGSPLQNSCLENPIDKNPWWATVHGVAKKS